MSGISPSVVDRAAAIKARNAQLCEQEGSGFHNEDKRSHGRPNSPQNRGLPSIDTHVVAFQGKWEHTFTGEDAVKVHMALKDFAEEHGDAITSGRTDPSFQAAVLAAKEYGEKGLTNGTLVIRNGQWNDVVHALDHVGIGITVAGEKAPLKFDPKRPS